MALRQLNALGRIEAQASFIACCGAQRWALAMADFRPFRDVSELHAAADTAFAQLTEADWLEAFAAHPRIGDTPHADKPGAAWSHGEQSRMAEASSDTRDRLVRGNQEYVTRFGFVFLVCATGKSPAEMLALLQARLDNGRDAEIRLAASEQAKITHLRIDKWVQP